MEQDQQQLYCRFIYLFLCYFFIVHYSSFSNYPSRVQRQRPPCSPDQKSNFDYCSFLFKFEERKHKMKSEGMAKKTNKKTKKTRNKWGNAITSTISCPSGGPGACSFTLLSCTTEPGVTTMKQVLLITLSFPKDSHNYYTLRVYSVEKTCWKWQRPKPQHMEERESERGRREVRETKRERVRGSQSTLETEPAL